VKISSEQDELLVGPALSNSMNLTFYQLGFLETSGVIKVVSPLLKNEKQKFAQHIQLKIKLVTKFVNII